MKAYIWTALKALSILTLLTGIIYPLIITGISSIFFSHQAKGSLILSDNKVIGSELICQKFDSGAFFWPRPSAIDYNPLPSGGSNLAPTSSALKNLVEERKNRFIQENLLETDAPVPAEMVYASASGLDPHISPDAARLQVERVCKARHFSTSEKEKLLHVISQLTEKPQFLIFGEERVNILLLNLELEKMQ
jgi:K+-transporting ATPase ATPase C chain